MIHALVHKYGQVQGITVIEDKITEWPDSLGAVPTKAKLRTIVAEYEQFLLDSKPLRDWEEEMSRSDTKYASPQNIARFMEDFYDANPDALAVKSQGFKDKHKERKEIRTRRVGVINDPLIYS